MSRSWTPKPYFCGGRAYYKAFSLSATGLLCALLLSSCGESSPSGYGGKPESSVSSPTLEPLTAPPNSKDAPPAPGTTGAPKTADGLPALQAKGLNTNLFSEKMSSETARLDRLENAVQELRNDFDNMAPAIVRLVAIEGDIQSLVKQLDVLTGKTPAGSLNDVPPIDESTLDQPAAPADAQAPVPPVDTAAPAAAETMPPVPAAPQPLIPTQPAPAQEPAVTPAPSSAATTTPAAAEAAKPASPTPEAAATSQGVAVMDIRVGEHPDKTRVVLDVRGKSSFTTDLDNQEKILVIEIPEAGWNAKPQMTFADSPTIASYSVQKSGDHGTRLVITLKKSAVISYKGTMDNDTKTGQKLVIDIAPSK